MPLLQGSLSSSAISSYEYDTATGLLVLTFRKGGTWHYYNVPQAVFRSFLNYGSPGAAFNALIRGVYD